MTRLDLVHNWLVDNSINILSPEEDIHLFFFADKIEDSPVVFLNRNGNHVRLIKGPDGCWRVYVTWASMGEGESWHHTSIFNKDIFAAIHKVPVGPKGDKPELLSLLPREASRGRRLAALRHEVFSVSFLKDGFGNWTKFQLSSQAGEMSPTIEGKVWESEEAFMWALDHLSPDAPPGRGRADTNPFVRDRVMEKVKVEMEDHPLFGEWA